MKKLFGGLNITWPKLILFAVICGVYTGVVAAIPALRDSSFQDISITFEWWILFALIIIVNSKSALDSACKVIVFFLISQPLVYLVQVPFNEQGFGLFRYYPAWFRWTLLTFPMAFVGWYMKKDKWWGLLILAPMLVFLGYHYYGFLGEAASFFPNHLLSAIFCAATLILYPLAIFQNKKLRIAGLAVSLVILAGMSFFSLREERSFYDTHLLPSDSEICGVEYDESWSASLADESYGEVEIEYMESIECSIVHAKFARTGHTQLILTSPEGEQYVYELEIQRSSYHVERKA
jgi:hypothetical protein